MEDTTPFTLPNRHFCCSTSQIRAATSLSSLGIDLVLPDRSCLSIKTVDFSQNLELSKKEQWDKSIRSSGRDLMSCRWNAFCFNGPLWGSTCGFTLMFTLLLNRHSSCRCSHGVHCNGFLSSVWQGCVETITILLHVLLLHTDPFILHPIWIGKSSVRNTSAPFSALCCPNVEMPWLLSTCTRTTNSITMTSQWVR